MSCDSAPEQCCWARGRRPRVTSRGLAVHAAAKVFLGVREITAGVHAATPPALLLLARGPLKQGVEHTKARGLASAVANHRPVHVVGVDSIVRENLIDELRIPLL